MCQIENFDFAPQNKIRICCLARSLQARSLRQQLKVIRSAARIIFVQHSIPIIEMDPD
jgi:hypothetical protein